MTMNANLTFTDWHSLHKLKDGMFGVHGADPNRPENPDETMARARIVLLRPGQPLFRWADSKGDGGPEKRAASPWWTSKRGAQRILAETRREGMRDTSKHARNYSNIARRWNSDLGVVVHAVVVMPINAFMGVGRDIHDETYDEVWNSRGLQLYIPNMMQYEGGKWVLSDEAKKHLRIVRVMTSAEFDSWVLEEAMREMRSSRPGQGSR